MSPYILGKFLCFQFFVFSIPDHREGIEQIGLEFVVNVIRLMFCNTRFRTDIFLARSEMETLMLTRQKLSTEIPLLSQYLICLWLGFDFSEHSLVFQFLSKPKSVTNFDFCITNL